MKQFLAVWGASFTKPETKVVDRDFFVYDNGYDVHDLIAIDELKVGVVWKSDRASDHTVTRLPDVDGGNAFIPNSDYGAYP